MSQRGGYAIDMRNGLVCLALLAVIAAVLGCGGRDGDGTGSDGGGGRDASAIDSPGGEACGATFCTAAQVCCVGCDGTSSCYAGDSCPGFMCPFDAGPPDAPPDSQILDAGAVVCVGEEHVFPDYGSGCIETADCEIGNHQIDCCGTFLAMGILRSERGFFDPAEATCASMYPLCGCAARPTMAEDGQDETAGTIMVACMDGECRTFVP
jgi:hypothetical protein